MDRSLLQRIGLALVLTCGSVSGLGQMPETTGVGLQNNPALSQGAVQSSQPGTPSAPGTANGSDRINGLTGSSETQTVSGAGALAASNSEQSNLSLQISIGDLLDISVYDTPDLSSRLRVNNRGDILLPIAGYVHVEGMTAPQAAQAVEGKLKDARIMLHPLVSVAVAQYATQGVTMAGEMRAPGVYQLLGPRTLLDMITMAGGLGDTASKLISIIHRNDPTKVITIRMNVGVQTPETFAAESYPIHPGDTIFVARSGLVYLVGDLKNPGSFQVEHNDRLTLLDAVALAGGPTPTSKLSDARLIRKSEHGREELHVDIKKLLYGTGPDMLLQDGDILFVPISQRKIYTQLAIQTVIGAATQYALFHETTN